MLPPKVLDQKEKIYEYLGTLSIHKDQVKNEELMLTAFIHKSYASDFAGDFVHNERLEFLGDAVLSAVVAKNIYKNYPERSEADLTLYKIALVRAENLALVAQEIGLDKVILL
jgi:ribonuclease III